MQTVKERLERLYQRHGTDWEDVASDLDVSVSFLMQIRAGKKEMGLKTLHRLELAEIRLGISQEGNVSYTNTTGLHRLAPNAAEGPLPRLRRVPVVSWTAAGQAHGFEDLANQIEETVETSSRDPNAFALIIEGDSMAPRFEAGDIVIFSPNSEARNGDFVVARIKDNDGVLFKRFRRTGREGQTIRLESLNPDYKPLEFATYEFLFIYPATEFRGLIRR